MSELFTPAEIQAVSTLQAANSGSAEDQFIRECLLLYRSWLDTKKRTGTAPAPANQCILFIFAEAPEIDFGFTPPPYKETRVRRRSGTLEQGVVVCNQNFAVMRRIVESLEIDDAYVYIEKYLNTKQTFCIALVGQQKMQIYRGGEDLATWINNPDEVLVNTTEVEVTPDGIQEHLSKFHHNYFSTPRAFASRNMWVLPNGKLEYQLRDAPERYVQSFILAHFQGLYSHAAVFVKEEISNQGGRVDIYIERLADDRSRKINTLMELKVLAPINPYAYNYEWAKKGIEQAQSYRNPDTDVSFACIFDARREKLKMPELEPLAVSKNVRLQLHEMELPPNKEPSEKKVKDTARKSIKKASTASPAKSKIKRVGTKIA